MITRAAVLIWCVLGSVLRASTPPTPEDFAFWLEQIPGTTSVLVLARWDVDHVQGWSFAICHDPAETMLGECTGDTHSICDSGGLPGCPAVECTADLAESPCFGPPDFMAINTYENGMTMGAVLWCGMMGAYSATSRIELLKITYTPRGESAALTFCNVPIAEEVGKR